MKTFDKPQKICLLIMFLYLKTELLIQHVGRFFICLVTFQTSFLQKSKYIYLGA